MCAIVFADERLFLVFKAETFPKQSGANGAFGQLIGTLVVPEHDLSLMCSAPVAQRAGLRRAAADGRYGERGMRVRHVYGRAQSVQAPYDIASRNCLRSLLRVAVVGGTHTCAYPGLFKLVSVYRGVKQKGRRDMRRPFARGLSSLRGTCGYLTVTFFETPRFFFVNEALNCLKRRRVAFEPASGRADGHAGGAKPRLPC